MRYLFILFIGIAINLGLTTGVMAQSPVLAFNRAANLFIEGNNEQALNNVNDALRRYPNDPQLKALKEKLEKKQKEEEKKKQQQQKQEQEKKNKQEQEQQKDGQSSEEEKKEEGQEKKEGEEQPKEKKEQQEKEGEKPSEEEKEGKQKKEQQAPTPSETEKRLEQMEISPEKARMILEAMKSKEVQYLQQKKRKATQRNDDGKPDW